MTDAAGRPRLIVKHHQHRALVTCRHSSDQRLLANGARRLVNWHRRVLFFLISASRPRRRAPSVTVSCTGLRTLFEGSLRSRRWARVVLRRSALRRVPLRLAAVRTSLRWPSERTYRRAEGAALRTLHAHGERAARRQPPDGRDTYATRPRPGTEGRALARVAERADIRGLPPRFKGLSPASNSPACALSCSVAGSARWFEELDGIPVRIFDLDLTPARPALHVVAKTKSCLLQFLDEAWQIGDVQHHAIPAARFLLLSIRHRSRTRSRDR